MFFHNTSSAFNRAVWSFIPVTLVIASILLAAPIPAYTEPFKQFGNYELHYNALHSIDIASEAARAHKLQRSPNIGMLNITLLKHTPEGKTIPEKATIIIESSNLAGQTKNLEAQPIQEPDALYYIAQFNFANEETFRFHISAIPDSAPDQRFEVYFTQTFYRAKP